MQNTSAGMCRRSGDWRLSGPDGGWCRGSGGWRCRLKGAMPRALFRKGAFLGWAKCRAGGRWCGWSSQGSGAAAFLGDAGSCSRWVPGLKKGVMVRFFFACRKKVVFLQPKKRGFNHCGMGCHRGLPSLFFYYIPTFYTMWCEYSYLPNTTKGFMHSINGFSRTSCFDLFRFCFDFLYQIIWACTIFLFMQGCLSPFSNSV